MTLTFFFKFGGNGFPECGKSKKNMKIKSTFVTANSLCVKHRKKKVVKMYPGNFFYAYLLATALPSV